MKEKQSSRIFELLRVELKQIYDKIETDNVPISEYEKVKMDLIINILTLSKRNKTLARMVILKNCPFLAVGLDRSKSNLSPTANQPRRGKKQEIALPLKLIMKILHCSHRSAVDYQLAEKLEEYFGKFQAAIHNDKGK